MASRTRDAPALRGRRAGQCRACPGGSPETASLGLEHDLFVTIPRGTYAALAATTDLTAQLVAPLREGTQRRRDEGLVRRQLRSRAAARRASSPCSRAALWTKVASGRDQLARVTPRFVPASIPVRAADQGARQERSRFPRCRDGDRARALRRRAPRRRAVEPEGAYLSLTITVRAESTRADRRRLQDLVAAPQVLIVL